MKLLRIASYSLAALLAGCATMRDREPELRGDGMEHACSTSPLDMLSAEYRDSAGGAGAFNHPMRFGLFFLPTPKGNPRVVPTREQQAATLRAIGERLVARPYVEDVIIVPTSSLGPPGSGFFGQIREFARRFDFDLVGLVTCARDRHEFELRPRSWITYLGDRVWLADVDQATTSFTLTLLEPVTRTTTPPVFMPESGARRAP